jgi:choline dehydrogenase-like flavoprotein
MACCDWLQSAHHCVCAVSQAAVQAGIPFNSDLNGPSQTGVGYAQLTVQDGVRVSTATAFLHPARKRKNLSGMRCSTLASRLALTV